MGGLAFTEAKPPPFIVMIHVTQKAIPVKRFTFLAPKTKAHSAIEWAFFFTKEAVMSIICFGTILYNPQRKASLRRNLIGIFY